MPHWEMWTEKPHNQRGSLQEARRRRNGSVGGEGEACREKSRERRDGGEDRVWGSGFWPADSEKGWGDQLTFSPCCAESPARRQQSQGEQPPGQCHLVIQLWRTGGPLGWVQVWAKCGLLLGLVFLLLEAGLDPCHQLLGILLSLGSCLTPGLRKGIISP